MKTVADAELYQRIKDKDKQAMEILYDRYEKILYSFVYKLTEDREAAEEVIQEVFIKLWRGVANYHSDRGKFSSWLFTLARNQAIDLIRKKKTNRLVNMEAIEPIVSPESTADEMIEWNEEKKEVRKAIRRLSEEQREIIQFVYFQGYTQQKIADKYKIPLGTVKSRVRLALRNLKLFLAEERSGRVHNEK